MNDLPVIIQSGLGLAASNWRLAQAVAQVGQLGVVSGTALEQILVRRLQDGDPGGHMRHGIDRFPIRDVAERVWRRYFIPGGKPARAPYATTPVHSLDSPRDLVELTVVASFVEVVLAREGHNRPVGIGYLSQVQLPILPSIYGAMLANVDYVLMGPGLSSEMPDIVNRLSHGEAVTRPLAVTGARPEDDFRLSFDPRTLEPHGARTLPRPQFLAFIRSDALDAVLRQDAVSVDGVIVDGPVADRHVAALRNLGLPFWLAGGPATPGQLERALAIGAAGLHVNAAFAFSSESALRDDLKAAVLEEAVEGRAAAMTDPRAAPADWPFAIARLPGTTADDQVFNARPRTCDLGYFREAYRRDDGSVEFRCPGEPIDAYVAKGGGAAQAASRRCLCNALLASVGLGQVRAGGRVEPALVPGGNDLGALAARRPCDGGFEAIDVVGTLLGRRANLAFFRPGAPAAPGSAAVGAAVEEPELAGVR